MNVVEECYRRAHDVRRATEIARAMVLEYGMGEALGLMTFPRQHHPAFLSHQGGYTAGGRDYSEAPAQALDMETKQILDKCLDHVLALLTEKRALLDQVSGALLAQEVVEGVEFEDMVQQVTVSSALNAGGV